MNRANNSIIFVMRNFKFRIDSFLVINDRAISS